MAKLFQSENAAQEAKAQKADPDIVLNIGTSQDDFVQAADAFSTGLGATIDKILEDENVKIDQALKQYTAAAKVEQEEGRGMAKSSFGTMVAKSTPMQALSTNRTGYKTVKKRRQGFWGWVFNIDDDVEVSITITEYQLSRNHFRQMQTGNAESAGSSWWDEVQQVCRGTRADIERSLSEQHATELTDITEQIVLSGAATSTCICTRRSYLASAVGLLHCNAIGHRTSSGDDICV